MIYILRGSYKIIAVCLSIHQCSIFLRNESLVFSDFWYDGKSLEYLKTGRGLFSKKIYFWPNLSKKGPKWPQNDFVRFFQKFIKNLTCFSWKWSKMKILLIFYHQSHIWQNSCSLFMGQNADNQSSEKHGGWSWFFACR